MIVVADSGPLHYLIWIGEIDVLRQLYLSVITPPSVIIELTRPNTPEPVSGWIQRRPEWLQTQVPQTSPDQRLLNARLGPGERDAIVLAQELKAAELIIDDRRGRKEAERRHLHVIGTLGILRAAARENLLDLKDVLNKLQKTNFYVSDDVIRRLLVE